MMVTERKKPLNLKERDEYLFKHEYIKSFDDPVVLVIKNVCCNHDLSIAELDKYPGQVAEKTSSFSRSFRSKIKTIIGFKIRIHFRLVVMITDGWSGGYFHWLLDCLPRLTLLNEEQLAEKIVLPHFLQQFSFVRESLHSAGIKNFIFLKKGAVYYFRKMIFPVHPAPTGNYNENTLHHLRVRLLKDITYKNETVADKIYISRRNTTRRRIANEEEVTELLKKHGYKTVYCEDMNFEEQAAVFSKLRCLIANHGAGLSNMLFMPEGSSVTELRCKGDRQNNCFYSLASAMKVRYHYLECEPVIEHEDPHTADTHVDIQQLELIINQYNL